MDKLLTPLILSSMIIGVALGETAPKMREALDSVKFVGVSLRKCVLWLALFRCRAQSLYTPAIAIGLMVMMWPALTKIRFESLPSILSTSRLWKHIGISVFLNWIVGPFVMLGLAWASLPDLPTYRTGVILVGIARCIAMVVIWNGLARGDNEYCAILVVLNAFLQMVLFSPFAVLFINVIGGSKQQQVHVAYGTVAISVLVVRPFVVFKFREGRLASVPWHTSASWNHHTFYCDISDECRLLQSSIPAILFALLAHRTALYHHRPFCIPRPPHSP